jgi:hypothetical protein
MQEFNSTKNEDIITTDEKQPIRDHIQKTGSHISSTNCRGINITKRTTVQPVKHKIP